MLKTLLSSVLVLGLLSSHAALAAGEVNIYSARNENLIKPLLDQFTEQTGIKVNLVTGKAEELLARLQSEGINSKADLIITVDAGNLSRAKDAGVLSPVDSSVLQDAIPENLRDQDNTWFGLSARARPIFYVEGKVNPSELSTYEDLTDAKWKRRICVRSSSNIYNQSMTASMLAHHGEAFTLSWAQGLVANFARPPAGGDRDQIKAAAAGQCDIAIANTYYFGQMLDSGDKAEIDAAKAMSIFWPNQDDRGTHINVSGIGLTTAAKNRANAVQLMEFLVSPAAQAWYAETNYEYPVVAGVPASATLQQWGDFKADALNLTTLGTHNADAVKLMDRAGWK